MDDDPRDGLSEAKQTLLRALEAIEETEAELDAEVKHVCVVYSVYTRDDEGKIHESGGWNMSNDPAWLIAAMLRRGADAVEESPNLLEEDAED